MSESARQDGFDLRRDQAASAAGRRVGSDAAAAQHRVHRIRAFRAELEALAAEGVAPLTAEQRREIDRHHEVLLGQLSADYDIDRTEAAGQLSRGMRIAAFFAAVALTAAVYSLVARFWGRLDLPLQATLLCAFPLMALVGVELTSRRERSLYVASIFAIAAYGTYWLAVIMLSQLLNVPLTPLPIWGGALFGLALGLAYGFRLILASALLVLLVALAGSVFAASGMPWLLVVEFPEIITAVALLLAAAAPSLQPLHPAYGTVTRLVGFGVAFLGLLMLSTAGRLSLLPSSRVAEAGYQVLMLIVCAIGIVVGLRRQWTETVYLSAAALTLFLLGRFVDWFWAALPRFVFFLLLAAIAFAWLVALRRLRRRITARVVA